MKSNLTKTGIIYLLSMMIISTALWSQNLIKNPELDNKVKTFLDKKQGQWHDMNVPASDGKILYDIIIKNKYKHAVEIGTSTGHSAIWIAWALSKTGGKLITIEIDKDRYYQSLANFKEAGLSQYIDARLDDAHKLVPKLNAPIDFVFCDADKDWYNNYFNDIEQKIIPGGCYTAHNISMQSWSRGIKDFIKNIKSMSTYETSIDNSGSSLSISYKKK